MIVIRSSTIATVCSCGVSLAGYSSQQQQLACYADSQLFCVMQILVMCGVSVGKRVCCIALSSLDTRNRHGTLLIAGVVSVAVVVAFPFAIYVLPPIIRCQFLWLWLSKSCSRTCVACYAGKDVV